MWLAFKDIACVWISVYTQKPELIRLFDCQELSLYPASLPTSFYSVLVPIPVLWPFQLYFTAWILPTTLRFLTLFFRSYLLLVLSTAYLFLKVSSFLFCSCIYFCLYGPFNCISFHNSSRQLSVFSLCSSGLMSSLLILSTIYLFLKVSFSPDFVS